MVQSGDSEGQRSRIHPPRRKRRYHRTGHALQRGDVHLVNTKANDHFMQERSRVLSEFLNAICNTTYINSLQERVHIRNLLRPYRATTSRSTERSAAPFVKVKERIYIISFMQTWKEAETDMKGRREGVDCPACVRSPFWQHGPRGLREGLQADDK